MLCIKCAGTGKNLQDIEHAKDCPNNKRYDFSKRCNDCDEINSHKINCKIAIHEREERKVKAFESLVEIFKDMSESLRMVSVRLDKK